MAVMPPVAPQAAAPAPQVGAASQLVGDVHNKLIQLAAMLKKSGDEQAVMQLVALIQGFESFTNEVLGASKAPAAPQAPMAAPKPMAAPGMMSPEMGGRPGRMA